MPEHIESICRGCFHSYVCEQFNAHRDSYNEKCHLFNDHFVPAADVVAVVRCKDCKHCVLTVDGEYNPEDIVCDWWATDGLKADGFCSYGERRGEDG